MHMFAEARVVTNANIWLNTAPVVCDNKPKSMTITIFNVKYHNYNNNKETNKE